MKYKVIGWTYYEDDAVLDKEGTIGFAERNAIIDEIRKHKYLFSGWHHQESWYGVVPILNDGKKRCFSQRGWGSVMAEAYGYMGDYDYSSFTFYQSIDDKNLRFAPDDFDLDDFVPENIENEDFKVEVSEALFEIAKTSNPFYLEDIDELRYLEANDTITLTCNGKPLYFVVKDVDRNKAEVGLKNHNELIKGKYKVIVTHKPESEREFYKIPLFITKRQAFDLFESAVEKYDYEVLKQTSEMYYITNIAEELNKKKVSKALTRFVKEYINDRFDSGNVIRILEYINNVKLFEEIAIQTLDKSNRIMIEYINHCEKKEIDADKYILMFVDSLKPGADLWGGTIKLIYEAIALRPNSKELRKKYYRAIKNTRHEGLPVMAEANLFKYLRTAERKLIEPDKYASYSASTIFKIVEYLTFPSKVVKHDNYPYGLSKIYEVNDEITKKGIESYQKYIKEHYDVNSFLEDMILNGIEKRSHQMDQYLHGERNAAEYICALDMLTNYKYNLKDKALEKYSSIYKDFKEELLDVYKE